MRNVERFCEYLHFLNLKFMCLSQDLLNRHCSVFVAHGRVPPVVLARFVYFQLCPFEEKKNVRRLIQWAFIQFHYVSINFMLLL